MTVQVDSQPVTDQNMWYIDMCCINNSISCSEKKTTFGTLEQTYYADFNASPHPFSCISEVYPSRAYWSTFSRACFVYIHVHHLIKGSITRLQVITPGNGAHCGTFGG